jgi:hypothetical protein
VHETALVDAFRLDPRGTLGAIADARRRTDPSFELPAAVRVLQAVFLDRQWSRDLVVKALRLPPNVRGI